MKKNFIFNRNGNEYFHKDYPSIRLDKEDFDSSSESEIENFIQSRIDSINKELSLKKKTKDKDRFLSNDEIVKSFNDLRNKLNQECFKVFFMKKNHLNL